MNKNLLFFGVGFFSMSILSFLLRLIKSAFFQANLNLFIISTVLSLIFLVWGLVKGR